jgi:hypothetical protein
MTKCKYKRAGVPVVAPEVPAEVIAEVPAEVIAEVPADESYDFSVPINWATEMGCD